MPSTLIMQDLTGKVRKTETHYFAHGGLADIWKGEYADKSSKIVQVAVKHIRGAWNNHEYLARLKLKLLREGTVWGRLNHPHITPFLGVCFDLDRPGIPCLVSPYYKNGDASTYLQEHPEVDRLKLITQVTAGLSYLHGLRPSVIHGDIKASNVLINNSHEASLTDFGLSRILESSGFTTKSVGGTCRWMAYELVAPCSDDEEEEEEYTPQLTTATDTWALAMTVVEILTGRLPFCHLKYDSAVILSVMRGGRPTRRSCSEIGDEIWSVLQRCWAMTPYHRPTMNSVALAFDIILSKSLSSLDIASIFDGQLDKHPSSFYSPTPNDKYGQESSNIDDHLHGNLRSSQSPGSLLTDTLPRSAEGTMHFPCHWPSCAEKFRDLQKCQFHEGCHLETWKHDSC